MVVIVNGCALFVTSHYNVIFTLPSQSVLTQYAFYSTRTHRPSQNPIFSISSHFVLWKAVPQIKYFCSPKVKHFAAPQILAPKHFGWLRHCTHSLYSLLHNFMCHCINSYQRSKLGYRSKMHSELRRSSHNCKISGCALKQGSKLKYTQPCDSAVHSSKNRLR